jgi:spore germination protein YaaH
MPRRTLPALGIALAIVVATFGACAPAPARTPADSVTAAPSGAGPDASVAAAATPRPSPGHEVFGYVPYWEMDEEITAHLRATDLTTLALFSVTNTRTGAIDTKQTGYRRITGDVGEQMIRAAHERGTRVELVFTSFGRDRNLGFFADPNLQGATIASLVALVGRLGLDGLDVDVEALDPDLIPAYGAFLGRVRAALVAADSSDRLSVATSASLLGATMAAAAAEAGVDRIFLMGYDYRVAGSEPGATAPLDRRDGEEKDLAWSLDLYAALGVPVERTLLGLPLYGLTWPVTDPELGAPATGRGDAWVPRRNLDLLRDPAAVPLRDDVEQVELYVLDGKGVPYSRPPVASNPPASPSAAAPSATPAGTASPAQAGPWQAIYIDSPATLAPKLALANERGLLGAGFWAIGYERGLPGYTDLIARFAAGEPLE